LLLKGGPTELQKFQIKYGWKELEIRNNSPYRNFSRFEMELGLKFREASMSWISLEKKLETLEFDEIWLASSLLHFIVRKNEFPAKEDQKVEFYSKWEIGLISW
jgi:hypothetical protein